MLWTMAEPLIMTQLGVPPKPMGNASTRHAPHGAWRCAGEDDWVSMAVRTDGEWQALCRIVPELSDMAGFDLNRRLGAQTAIDAALAAWAASRSASAAADSLLQAGIPAAALARHGDLVTSPHLAARDFWERQGTGVLPGLPWRASFGRVTGPAPGLGADSSQVLADVLGLPSERIVELRANGALG
jgi:crotonobetainyl-CoA:carnitine CoA-transferase CaiB-like acyl-CoA transferase